MTLPYREAERLVSLHRCCILDTQPEPFFDHIATLAAQFFVTPMAAISFVDQDRTWLKSHYGFEQSQFTRQASFCAHTILGQDHLVIPDAAADDRFAALEPVTGAPGIRFYAGVPLNAPGRLPIGTLAVMDTHPRAPLPDTGLDALLLFAHLIEHEIERRIATSTGLLQDPGVVEQSLREAEERFRVASENASDLVWEWDIPSNRITTFGSFPLRLGYTQEEIPQTLEDWMTSLHPDDRARVHAAIRRTLTHGEPFRQEYRTIRRRDGAVHYWSDRASLLYDDSGNPRKLIGVMSDITEHRRAEQALSELAAIVQCSEEAIISATLDGAIRTWNPAAEKLYGYSAAEALGRHISLFVPPELVPEQGEIFRKVCQGEPVLRHETVRLRKDGSRVPVSFSLSEVKDLAGRPVAISSVTSDITRIKQAETARREGEARLRLAQDAIGIGIWDWCAPEDGVTCSEPYFRLYGLSRHDSVMSFDEWYSLVHPEDRERMRIFIDEAARQMAQFETEFRVIWPDGSIHWLVTKAKVNRDAAGQPVRVIGVNLDITELREAEQARREAEQRYEHLFRTMGQGVLYFDGEGRVLSANPSAERILGMTIGEMQGRHRSGLFWLTTREDGSPFPAEESPALAALRTGSDSHNLIVNISSAKSQERRWVSIDAFPQFRPGDSRPYQVYSIFQDITRRFEAEASLRASEERFRLLIEHATEVIGTIDAGAVILYLSPSVERIMGYRPDSLIGSNAFDYVHPDDRPTAQSAFESIVPAPNSNVTVRFRFRHTDGAWRFLEVVASNALHVKGLQGIIFNARDITGQKQAQDQLLESRDQLRLLAAHVESTREQERIRISREIHDQLGQMLSAFRLDLEGLGVKHRPAGSAARKEFSGRIAGMIRNIDHTIESVRRISAELRPDILDHFGLASALECHVEEFESRTRIRCRCHGLDGALNLAPEPSTVVFRIFQEIFTNIARHAQASAVVVEVVTEADWLILTVADNGSGFDPGHLTNPRSLGLVGMRERALLIGGTVEFSPSSGGGTLVTVRIPAQPSAAAPGLSPSALPALLPGSAYPRILLADGHEIYRKGIKALLAETWPEASYGEVDSARQAVDAVQAGSWDILLLELSMPRDAGFRVLDALCALPLPVRVLVISTHAEAAWVRRVRRAGASGYVTNSSSPDQITNAIAAVLSGRKSFPD